MNSLTRNKVSFTSVNISSFCLILFKSLFKSSPENRLLLGLHLLLALPIPMAERESSIRICTIIALRLVVTTDDVAMSLIIMKFQFRCSNFRSFYMPDGPYLIDKVEHITQVSSKYYHHSNKHISDICEEEKLKKKRNYDKWKFVESSWP